MARYKREQIVDRDTGEVVYDRTKPLTMYLFSEEKGYLLFHNRLQVKWFPTIPWPEGLSTKEQGYLFRLSAYLNKENRWNDLSIPQLGEIINLSPTRAYRFFRKLKQMGMVQKTKYGYYMNPMYLFAGKYLTRELYQLFREQLDPYIPDWVKNEIRRMTNEPDQRTD